MKMDEKSKTPWEKIKTKCNKSTYKSFSVAMFPISLGTEPVSSFHMKSLPLKKKKKDLASLK